MKILAALVILSITDVLKAFSSSSPRNQVTCLNPLQCPCGRTGKNVTICAQDKPCSIWSKCKTCLDGLDRCLECPEGTKGPLCHEGHRFRRFIFCRDPGEDPNGSRNPQSLPNPKGFPQGSRIEYSCNEGYNLDGEANLFCLTTGEWSSGTPRCRTMARSPAVSMASIRIKFCDNPGPITNGRTMVIVASQNGRESTPIALDDDTEEFPVGSRLNYSCDQGYSLEGPSSATCEASGGWSAAPPRCRTSNINNILYCLNPGPKLNGRINYHGTNIPTSVSNRRPSEDATEFPEGTTLEYHCDEGFQLIGAVSITCESSGFWSDLPPHCVADCGRSPKGTNPRITSDSQTAIGDWPWVVGIATREDNFTRLICPGALLNTQTVITAAHCLSGTSQVTLFFGKYYRLISLDDDRVLNRTSDKLIIHPEYKEGNFDSDLALVTFKPKVDLSDRIRTICLPTGRSTAINLQPGVIGYITGWHLTERGLISNELLVSRLPFVTNTACLQSFSEINLGFLPALSQTMFCAGFHARVTCIDDKRLICIGGSGAPLVFLDSVSERYTLEGLSSWSPGGRCGHPGRYTVFTQVVPFLPWIYRNMQIN